MGLRIAGVVDDRVLLLEPVQRGGDLVLVAAGLRLDGEGGGGLGELDRRHDDAAPCRRACRRSGSPSAWPPRRCRRPGSPGRAVCVLPCSSSGGRPAPARPASSCARGVGLERAGETRKRVMRPACGSATVLNTKRGRAPAWLRRGLRPRRGRCAPSAAGPPATAAGRRSRRAGLHAHVGGDEVGTTGKIAPRRRRAAARHEVVLAPACPCRRTPPSARRRLSATISIRASRAAFAAADQSRGNAPTAGLPLWSVAKTRPSRRPGRSRPRTLLLAERKLEGTPCARRRRAASPACGSGGALAIHAVHATMRGRPSSSAASHTFSVCTSTPPRRPPPPAPVGDAQRGAGLGQEVRQAGGVEEVDLGLVPLGLGHAVWRLCFRSISSWSKSVTVVPSSTRPSRLTAPASKRIAETSRSCRSRAWPTSATFLMLAAS